MSFFKTNQHKPGNNYGNAMDRRSRQCKDCDTILHNGHDLCAECQAEEIKFECPQCGARTFNAYDFCSDQCELDWQETNRLLSA